MARSRGLQRIKHTCNIRIIRISVSADNEYGLRLFRKRFLYPFGNTGRRFCIHIIKAVSYTHLTLPTILRV